MDGFRFEVRKARGYALAVAAVLLLPVAAHAQKSIGPLTALDASFNPLEQAAAFANQAIYNALTAPTNPTGGGAICGAPGQGQCTGAVLAVFTNVRQLVETANQILSGQPNQYSLNIDTAHLGFALRWTAAEEVFAQSSIARRFANNQVSALGNRIAAIRAVSRASLRASDERADDGTLLADAGGSRGGGASADAQNGGLTRWGLFGGSAGGWGDHAPTTYEDAFAYDGQEYSGGVDYRFSDSLVTGVLVGASRRKLTFDPNQSVVDGGITADGVSGLGYLQWDRPRYYANLGFGYQGLKYDIRRAIKYSSNNPLQPGVNAIAQGNTNSSALLATFNLGVPFEWKTFGIDLYVKADYQHISIDAYQERDGTPSHTSTPGFNQQIGKQTLKSCDAAVGLKLQAVWTPSFAVVIPYIRGEYHRELANQDETLSTIYAGLPQTVLDALATSHFSLTSEPFDRSYYTATAGMSAVLRGSQRIGADGLARGGIQAFVQYSRVFQLTNYRDHVIAGGIRYEF